MKIIRCDRCGSEAELTREGYLMNDGFRSLDIMQIDHLAPQTNDTRSDVCGKCYQEIVLFVNQDKDKRF